MTAPVYRSHGGLLMRAPNPSASHPVLTDADWRVKNKCERPDGQLWERIAE